MNDKMYVKINKTKHTTFLGSLSRVCRFVWGSPLK